MAFSLVPAYYKKWPERLQEYFREKRKWLSWFDILSNGVTNSGEYVSYLLDIYSPDETHFDCILEHFCQINCLESVNSWLTLINNILEFGKIKK